MQRLFGVLARVAAHDAPVLITGESGTGKELAARAIHDEGGRGEGPFVALNCAALPDAIIESELFGHEKGAFTGAVARQDGAFQRADKGTLFLDEIGEMRVELQAKLLRALECGEVRRVGGQRAEFPDVRVVAATHRNLPAMVRAGQFREDLWFRLAVLTVRMPSLKDRRADIPAIARALLQRNHPGARLAEAAAAQLATWEWPGNVRELRNVLTRAYVMGGPVIEPSFLEFHPWAFDDAGPALAVGVSEDDERRSLNELMARHGGNRSRAAEALGIPRTSLLYKLRKHGLG
jgi:DNA-binding NtrC family response regulator